LFCSQGRKCWRISSLIFSGDPPQAGRQAGRKAGRQTTSGILKRENTSDDKKAKRGLAPISKANSRFNSGKKLILAQRKPVE
jgi:hypothetical protein